MRAAEIIQKYEPQEYKCEPRSRTDHDDKCAIANVCMCEWLSLIDVQLPNE